MEGDRYNGTIGSRGSFFAGDKMDTLIPMIRPYVGIGDVNFGSCPADIAKYWGPPDSIGVTRLGEFEETRGDSFFRYKDEKLVEVSFGRIAHVSFQGIDLTHDSQALATLLAADPNPLTLHGFLVFFLIGIAVTGIQDGEDDQIAVTVFNRGRWDLLKPKMEPFNLSNKSSAEQLIRVDL